IAMMDFHGDSNMMEQRLQGDIQYNISLAMPDYNMFNRSQLEVILHGVSSGDKVLVNQTIEGGVKSVFVKSINGQQFFLQHYIDDEDDKVFEWQIWFWIMIGLLCGVVILSITCFIGIFCYFKLWKMSSVVQTEVNVLRDFHNTVGTSNIHQQPRVYPQP
ncbi:unnamed protein product, partial [Meganyctiphanes norvegica]